MQIENENSGKFESSFNINVSFFIKFVLIIKLIHIYIFLLILSLK